jgi:CheY-like chemotaxis protein
VRDVANASCDLSGLHVLVVDDGDTNRKLIRLLLERGGAKVRMAENGQVAVDLAQSSTFDVILMDMQMPVMDGYTATARLRASGFAGPIIALTALAMKGDREKCETAGCTGYIAKPIDAVQLFQVLGEYRKIHSQAARNSEQRPSGQSDEDLGSIHSLLPMDDHELRDIVTHFLDSLESKLSEMQTAWDEGDYEELTKLAHWLKGAGGTVGFGCFTAPAADLELHAEKGDSAEAESALSSLRDLQRRLVV